MDSTYKITLLDTTSTDVSSTTATSSTPCSLPIDTTDLPPKETEVNDDTSNENKK